MQIELNKINLTDLLTIIGGMWIFYQFILKKRKESQPLITLQFNRSSNEEKISILVKDYMAIKLKIVFTVGFDLHQREDIYVPIIPANEKHEINIDKSLRLFLVDQLNEKKESPIGYITFFSERYDFYRASIYVYKANLYLGKPEYSYYY